MSNALEFCLTTRSLAICSGLVFLPRRATPKRGENNWIWLHSKAQEQPDYPQAWSYLGLTDAMLGRCGEAMEEGKRACEILPYTKDSWIGSTFITYLAEIYAACGEKEAALQQLKISAELPTGVTYG